MHLRVEVPLGDRAYPVLIGSNLIPSLPDFLSGLSPGSSCAVISDSNVAPLYAAAVEHSLAQEGFQPTSITIPAGEKSKSLDQVRLVCEQMAQARLDRKSFLVALGGGVVGDLAGFVAAVYHRGIDCVQLPTTVVAQVDSAIGGKTGVNLTAGKNLVGAFHQPRLVVADVDTLKTLPEREFDEGFAEIIKHAIIRDREMFYSLENFNRTTLPSLIARNVEIKANIVAADERERSGERALLNFGHTIGHAIEAAAGYGRYLHGEAISLGIVAASEISARKAGLEEAERARIIATLRQFNLPTRLEKDVSAEAIMIALTADKKFEQGHLRFVLCRSIGDAYIADDVTLEEIRAAVTDLS